MSRHPPMRVTKAAFFAEASRRFGSDMMNWRFVCPCCGVETATKEWRDVKAASNSVGFSCIGRYKNGKVRDALTGSGKGPCNYAGGGLFRLNPMIVVDEAGVEHQMFALAGEPFPAAQVAA